MKPTFLVSFFEINVTDITGCIFFKKLKKPPTNFIHRLKKISSSFCNINILLIVILLRHFLNKYSNKNIGIEWNIGRDCNKNIGIGIERNRIATRTLE
jgi:hypothetical protein